MKLAAARIFVRDLDEAHRFYGSTLGLPCVAGGPAQGWCVYAPGSTQVIVEPVGHDAPADEQILVGRFTGLSFAVTSVMQTYASLKAQGVVFDGEPETQPWGGTLATLCDPAGNRLQLVQPPGAA